MIQRNCYFGFLNETFSFLIQNHLHSTHKRMMKSKLIFPSDIDDFYNSYPKLQMHCRLMNNLASYWIQFFHRCSYLDCFLSEVQYSIILVTRTIFMLQAKSYFIESRRRIFRYFVQRIEECNVLGVYVLPMPRFQILSRWNYKIQELIF